MNFSDRDNSSDRMETTQALPLLASFLSPENLSKMAAIKIRLKLLLLLRRRGWQSRPSHSQTCVHYETFDLAYSARTVMASLENLFHVNSLPCYIIASISLNLISEERASFIPSICSNICFFLSFTGTCTPKTKVPQKPQGQLKGNIYRRSTYNIKLLLINDA